MLSPTKRKLPYFVECFPLVIDVLFAQKKGYFPIETLLVNIVTKIENDYLKGSLNKGWQLDIRNLRGRD